MHAHQVRQPASIMSSDTLSDRGVPHGRQRIQRNATFNDAHAHASRRRDASSSGSGYVCGSDITNTTTHRRPTRRHRRTANGAVDARQASGFEIRPATPPGSDSISPSISWADRIAARGFTGPASSSLPAPRQPCRHRRRRPHNGVSAIAGDQRHDVVRRHRPVHGISRTSCCTPPHPLRQSIRRHGASQRSQASAVCHAPLD